MYDVEAIRKDLDEIGKQLVTINARIETLERRISAYYRANASAMYQNPEVLADLKAKSELAEPEVMHLYDQRFSLRWKQKCLKRIWVAAYIGHHMTEFNRGEGFRKARTIGGTAQKTVRFLNRTGCHIQSRI